MKNSEIVRSELSLYNKNEMIFAGKLYKEKLYFHGVSETSFYKTLERMYKNKKIEKLSKGVYYFPETTKYGIVPISEDKIIHEFTNNNEGMIVGYELYNKYQLTTQVAKKISIYSSNVDNEIKNLRNIEIKNVQLKFNNEFKKNLEILEILENFYKIQDINYYYFYEFLKQNLKFYNDKIFDKINTQKKYKKSTISFLKNALNYFNITNNLDKYLSNLSKYKHLTTEEIYELARKSERF